ncbi:MAG: potassium transporter Kup [Vicinamibacterales bacterium]
MSRRSRSASRHTALLPVTLSALGVVFGDIGTSPLYTIRECFFGTHSVPPTHENVLGVLSLVFYSLLIVIAFKYIGVVMRADNKGEGGILALSALLPTHGIDRARPVLVALGIFGAALLYGDGMITPAITVLSAVEGLHLATPLIDPYVVPIAAAIIGAIFAIQRGGTHSVGRIFGPVMVVWFVTLGALGLPWILREPAVLGAINPGHAVTFFAANGFQGFAVLGAVVLVVTGGEALYADMGHFGTRPIRSAWFALVFPALLLNYFGQGALLLTSSEAARQPFFLLAPGWALFPLVLLATAAAIIASQALISGVFSLTHQAVQLGYSPRLDIDHTSSQHAGQIYVPQANWLLMIGTLGIVLTFQTSSSLAAAYGIAVTLTMACTTVLLYVVAVERWHWPVWIAGVTMGTFLLIDTAFFGANLLKIFDGGWLPIGIAVILFVLMTTWKWGRQILGERLVAGAIPLERFMARLEPSTIRVPGTSVFMTAQTHGTPPALVHNLKYNKVLHERVIVLTARTTRTPHVTAGERLEVESLGHNVYNVTVRYGFMDEPHIPEALALASEQGLDIDPDEVTYFLGKETVIVTRARGLKRWRENLFIVMARNAVRATAFFRLPPERVVELGVQVEI